MTEDNRHLPGQLGSSRERELQHPIRTTVPCRIENFSSSDRAICPASQYVQHAGRRVQERRRSRPLLAICMDACGRLLHQTPPR